MLLFTCTKVFCRYIYDTVCINIEGNLNLRNTSSCRKNAIQTEGSQCLVVLCELSLALYNVDINSGLVISCGREDLALLGRDCGISLNQSGRLVTVSFVTSLNTIAGTTMHIANSTTTTPATSAYG